MLKKTLAGYFFLGLLSAVRSDPDYRTSLVGSFKDKCSELLDQSACIYWDSFQDDTSESQAVKATDNHQQEELSSDNSDNSTALGKQTSEETSEEFPVVFPFLDPGSNVDKRFNVFRRRNPNGKGYKRGPGFRSWGGKRNFYLENPSDKRTKFASWGGKRDDFSNEGNENDKRSKFGNWGGKRDFDYPTDKRTGFKSWGGKRIIPFENIMKKDAEISPYETEKRNPVWRDALYLNEPYKKHFPKRPQFQSWGGKRALYPLHRLFAFLYARPVTVLNGEKRKFSSWGGKRSYENQYDTIWGEMKNELKRHNFQSWGGKRAIEGESQDAKQIEKRETLKTNSKNEESDLGFGVWGEKQGGGR